MRDEVACQCTTGAVVEGVDDELPQSATPACRRATSHEQLVP
jgi:hypothetical protein